MTITAADTPGEVPRAGPVPAARVRRSLGPALVVACVVLLLAEFTVRTIRPRLPTPNLWPQPELQKKFAQVETLARRGQRPDVVLVGDSSMDAAGDPEALMGRAAGLRVYNASVAGAVLPEISKWTTQIVVPRLHPKLVVIGVSSNELSPQILHTPSALAYQDSRVVRAASGTGNAVDRADAWLRRWSVLYRYRSVLRDPFVGAGPSPGVFDPVLTSSGQDLAFADQSYLQAGGPMQAQLVLAGVKAALQGFTVSPVNVGILEGLIQTLRRQGIKVLLIAMPVTQDVVSLHPAGAVDYERAIDSLSAIAARTAIAFLQPGIWATSAFADPVHLNAVGTAQFTTYLGETLHNFM